MASIYDLKPAFQRRLRPIVERLAERGFTANQVTLAALLLSALEGLVLFLWPGHWLPLVLLPVVLFLRMALNAIDGMLAREHAMKSRLGAILNELGDVLSDAALYLPLALVPGIPAALLVLTVVLGIIGEMTGVVAVQVGSTRRYEGPFGKSDRAFALGALGLLLGLGVPAGGWLIVLFWILLLLAFATILNRARWALASPVR